MENVDIIVTVIFKISLFFSILFSVFFGVRANYVDKIKYKGEHPCIAEYLNAVYNFIFHFLGSFTGWVLLYVLVLRIKPLYPDEMNQIGLMDVLLLLITFIGITGHLPQSTYGFVSSFKNLADSFAKKYL